MDLRFAGLRISVLVCGRRARDTTDLAVTTLFQQFRQFRLPSAIQPVANTSIVLLVLGHKTLPMQRVQRRLEIGRGLLDAMFEQPPLGDAIERILSFRVLNQILDQLPPELVARFRRIHFHDSMCLEQWLCQWELA